MGYQLICNEQPRELHALADMPEKARDWFDYVSADDAWTPRFFCYRGEWYDAHDAQRIEIDRGSLDRVGWSQFVHPGEPLARFDAIATDSFYSGLAWRFIGRDADSVIVARFYS